MKFMWIPVVAVLSLLAFSARAADEPMLYFGPLENGFASVEKAVPGFAGWYFERDGTPVVMVKDLASAHAAIDHVRPILAARPPAQRGPSAVRKNRITARQARFAFSELAQFRYLISTNLPAGVHMIDADEVRNVVRIFVDDGEALGVVRATAARLGIPRVRRCG